ncbi:MAG: trehalose-phosphatase [Endomicrobiales bacterium]
MNLFIFIDYDGTLVPIRSAPGEAVLSKTARKTLKEVSETPGVRVAVVTGRSLKDIKGRVGLKNIAYAGNHGLEIEGPGIPETAVAGASSRELIRRIGAALKRRVLPVRGTLVEDKGLTLSLHYRRVRPKEVPQVLSVFKETVRPYLKMKKIKVSQGKKVLEVRPPADWDKGRAVRWILARAGAFAFPVYLGDDVTDESAFKALRKTGMTVFVGKPGPTAAEYRLKNTRSVLSFLKNIREAARAR